MTTDNPTIDPQALLAHVGWLQRLAARLVEPSAADDLVQDTYVAALKSPPLSDRPPRPWLAQVLRNLVRNRARGHGRWRARAQRLSAEPERALPSAEELLTQHEARRLVAELVSRLQEPFRSTVLLCYGQGLSPAEVARQQGIPGGTVRWRLKRGLDDLRAALDARYNNDRRAWSLALAPLAAGAVRVTGAGLIGAVKLGAVTAVAAALVLWLGSWASSRSPDERGAAPDPAARPATRSAVNTVPALLAPPPGGPGAGGQPPERALAAAAPAAGRAGPPAGNAGRTEEVMARVMAPGNAPTKGPPDAPVTVVAFIGYQCPFSARAQPTLVSLLEAYPKEVRLVIKQLPMSFHEQAKLAAEAALAAHDQGKYWAMHERLFANQKALDPPALEEHARAIGLDIPRFRKALVDKQFLAALEEDIELAREADIRGTPAFFINGRELKGAQPLPAFKELVDASLAKASEPPAPVGRPGTPPPGGAPLGERRRMDVTTRDWPPARLALPDELLGERLRVPFPTGDAPTAGAPRAPVEVVYLNDYDCLGCGRGKPLVDGLRDVYGSHLRIVARPVPSSPQKNPNGPLVAEAAWAAHAQGRFWQMHDKLFSLDLERNRATLERYAEEIGLDLAAFRDALDDGRYRKKVAEDVELLDQAGLKERPLFVVNGRRADGPIALVALVEAALKKAGIKPPAPPGPPGAPVMLVGLTMPQRFHFERRHEAWAAPVEKPVAQMVERDLRAVDPDATGLAVDCRTMLCRLRFRPGKARAASAALLKQVYAADVPPPTTAPQTQAYLILGGGGGQGPNPEESLARLKSRRATLLFSLRTGRVKADPDLPVAKLPEK